MGRLQLEVYQSDAEAFDATAELAAEVAQTAVRERGVAHVALAGGRGGRGAMLALAARGDLPWDRIEWWLGDERCVPATDPRSNQRLARESLFVPRGVAAARIHVPPVALAEPTAVAAAYGTAITAVLGPAPVFDLVLLGMGADGHIASLMPGSGALGSAAPVATVEAREVAGEPRVARVTLTSWVLSGARCIIVTATGVEKAAMLRHVLRDQVAATPAALVRPSATVTWVIDRAAAGDLLRDAEPAPA